MELIMEIDHQLLDACGGLVVNERFYMGYRNSLAILDVKSKKILKTV
jgi:hypothetical protein